MFIVSPIGADSDLHLLHPVSFFNVSQNILDVQQRTGKVAELLSTGVNGVKMSLSWRRVFSISLRGDDVFLAEKQALAAMNTTDRTSATRNTADTDRSILVVELEAALVLIITTVTGYPAFDILNILPRH